MERSWENHGKNMGKPRENHGKTMGKPWEIGDLYGKPLLFSNHSENPIGFFWKL